MSEKLVIAMEFGVEEIDQDTVREHIERLNELVEPRPRMTHVFIRDGAERILAIFDEAHRTWREDTQ